MCIGTDSMDAAKSILPTRLDMSLTSDMSCLVSPQGTGLASGGINTPFIILSLQQPTNQH